MKSILLSVSLLVFCCACSRHSKEEVAPFNAHYALKPGGHYPSEPAEIEKSPADGHFNH